MEELLIDPEFVKALKDYPDHAQEYLARYNRYKDLCSEVVFALRKRVIEAGIEHSSISPRVKSLGSFVSKVERKEYIDPFREATDLAGVRLVYLYKNDTSKIEGLIYSEFDVIEKVDKITDYPENQFGYGAIHYLVRIKNTLGARYENLKDLVCELQVRTVLQDAWAIIHHHLVYKKEADVPKVLKRKLNSLAGLIEIADAHFESVRLEREAYIKNIEPTGSSLWEFFNEEVNYDTVHTLLLLRFPEIKVENQNGHISRIIEAIDIEKYPLIKDLDDALSKTETVREEFNKRVFDKLGISPMEASAAELAKALAFIDEEYRHTVPKKEYVEIIEELLEVVD